MAEIDQYELFSSNQAITGAAISDNIVDLKAARHFGTGPRALYAVVHVTVAATDASNNSTVNVYLQTDDNTGFNSATNMGLIGVIPTNAAVGPIIMPLPPGVANEQYGALYYDVQGGNFSTLSVTSYATPDVQAWTPLAVAYTGPTV